MTSPNLPKCTGNGLGHCCHLGVYGVCKFLLVDEVPDRRFACALRHELGSWDAVHTDRRYLTAIKPKLVEIGIREDCGDWPDERRRAEAPAEHLCCFGSDR